MATTRICLLLMVFVKNAISATPLPELSPVPINVTCVSQDWEHLTCTWCPDVPHSHIKWVSTYYSFYGERKLASYPCPDLVNNCTCNICGRNCPHLSRAKRFHPRSNYTITVEGKEIRGGKRVSYSKISKTIYPRSLVKLSRVQSLIRTRVTSVNITVQWNPPSGWPKRNFPVEYQVTINTSEFDYPKKNEVGGKTSHTFTGLQPFTKYEIGVTAKPVGSVYHSDPMVIVVWTKEGAPEVAPTVYSGSFRILEYGAFERKIRLYWKNVPPWKSNGNLVNCTISFRVSEGVNSGKTENQQSTKCSHETMESIILANQSYEVQLRAFTRVGPSPAATWFIPISAPPYPLNAFAETVDNSNIMISWQEPNSTRTPLSYTIYQCHNPMDDETSCLNMTVTKVPRNQTRAILQGNIESKTRYTISTEDNSSSSGMMSRWLCVFSHELGPTEVNFNVNQSEGSGDIVLSWKPLEQTCDVNAPTGLPEYINISWCQTANCQATADNVRIERKEVSYKISKVKPYTNYTITVTAESTGIKGKRTQKIFLTENTENGDDPLSYWLVMVLAASLLFACVGLALLFCKCWRSLKAWYKFPKPEILELDFDLEIEAGNVYTHAAKDQFDNCSCETLNVTAPYNKSCPLQVIGRGDLGTSYTTDVSLEKSAHEAEDLATLLSSPCVDSSSSVAEVSGTQVTENHVDVDSGGRNEGTLMSSACVDSSNSAGEVSGTLVTGNQVDNDSGGRNEETTVSPNHGNIVYDMSSGDIYQQDYKTTKLYFKMGEFQGGTVNASPPNGMDVRKDAVSTNGSEEYESTRVQYMYMGGDYINTISQKEQEIS